MKPNRFKRVLAEGRVAVGHMLTDFGVRSIAQILDNVGVDFVFVDMEHGAFTSADVANLIAWFGRTDIAPFVRVPQLQYHFIARALDSGALGVMVPDVEDAGQARTLVDAAKYAPLGKRGVGLGTNADYKAVNLPEFLNHSNENTTVMCMIESVAGLSNVEEICATPGVDALFVGYVDLTQSMGIAGQYHHERFLDALKRIVAVGKKHGLGVGIQPRDLTQAQEWLSLGFNVMSYSGDVYVYMSAMKQGIDTIRRWAGQ
jgi:2-keto-3-deoxy-L-rhamnonate aldolase RhmA